MNNYFSIPISDYTRPKIRVGPDDCIYILDSTQVDTIPWTTNPSVRKTTLAVYQGHVSKFSKSGQLLCEWPTGNYENDYFLAPGCIAIGPDGRVYVGEYNRAKRDIPVSEFNPVKDGKRPGLAKVTVFDSDGKLLDQWGERGKEVSQFRSPTAISIGSDNSVLLGDRFYARVHRFTSSGAFISCSNVPSSTESTRPWLSSVAISTDNSFYAAVYDQICKFDADGSLAFKWGGNGTGPGEFDGIGGIALDRDNKLYVLDAHQWNTTHPWVRSRIQVFDTTGDYLGTVKPDALLPTTVGDWGHIVEMTLDQEGRLYTLNLIEGSRYVVLSTGREIPLTTADVGSLDVNPLDLVRHTLYQGLENKLVLNVMYMDGPGESSSRLIEVHRIGPYYFDAYCRLRNDFRTFVISRVRNAQLSGESFELRSDYQPTEWVDSPGPVN